MSHFWIVLLVYFLPDSNGTNNTASDLVLTTGTLRTAAALILLPHVLLAGEGRSSCLVQLQYYNIRQACGTKFQRSQSSCLQYVLIYLVQEMLMDV
jgi:hypothetical protein